MSNNNHCRPWRRLMPHPTSSPAEPAPLLSLLKWLLLGSLVGLIVGALASGFGHVLILVNNLRTANPWLVFGLPVGGLCIVLLYRVCKNTADRGTNTVISSVQGSPQISFKTAPLSFRFHRHYPPLWWLCRTGGCRAPVGRQYRRKNGRAPSVERG